MSSRMLVKNTATLIKANRDMLAYHLKLAKALPYLRSLPALMLWDFDTYYIFEEKTGELEVLGDFYRRASRQHQEKYISWFGAGFAGFVLDTSDALGKRDRSFQALRQVCLPRRS